MNTGHTPGPWSVEETYSITKGARDFMLRAADEKYLCAPCEGSDDPALIARDWIPLDEARANANLIAAAPELLAACKAVMEFLSNGTPVNPGSLVQAEVFNAIQKATK